MKTHLLYIGLAVAVLVLGLLAGSHLPAGIEAQPVQGQPVDVAGPVAPSPLPTQPPKLRATLPGNTAVVFTADGKTLASVYMEWDSYGSKCAVKLWDVATAKERQSFKIAGPGDSPYSAQITIAITPDGTALAAAYQWLGKKDGPGYAVKVWDVASGKERAVFQDQTFVFKSVAFSSDGKTLAMAAVIPGTKPAQGEARHTPDPTGAIKLWDVTTGKDRALLKSSIGVQHAAFSPDGKLLASLNGAVTLWDIDEGKERDAFPASAGIFSFAAFTPDGKTVAAAGQTSVVARDHTGLRLDPCGIVRLWDVVTGQELATLRAHQGSNPVTALAITADGKTLASASGGYRPKPAYQVEGWGEVKLWDLPSGRAWATIKGLQAPPSSLAFTPDGKVLATVGHRGDLKLWDMPAK
jgi:WD40 repeat protein